MAADQARGDMLAATAIPCPVCEGPARVLDWPPSVGWLVIEGCACDGYRIKADLLATRRLKKLTPAERNGLQGRIHAMHASGRFAWVDTVTGTMRGPLVVLAAQPRNPQQYR